MVIQTFEIYNLKMEVTFSSKHGEFRIKISESFTATSIFSLKTFLLYAFSNK